MWQLLGILRLIAIIPVVLIGLVLSLFIWAMPQVVFEFIARLWYRVLLILMGLRCSYQGEDVHRVALVLSNHISWADILVIGARWPMVFLAMKSVASWPLIGWLATRAGTLFIERGKGSASAGDQVKSVLLAGNNVVIFPEGRTTIGISVGKFFPRLLQAAIDAEVPVQALGLFYSDSDDLRTKGSRITFADDAGFFAGAWRTLCGPPINVDIKVFPPIQGDLARQEIADQAFSQIDDFVNFTKNS